MKFTVDTFISADESVFHDWYDSNLPIMKQIEKHVREDLEGFASQIETFQLSKLDTRLKSKVSFIDKIRDKTTGEEAEKLRRKFGNNDFSITDVVQDLIGVRFVMYSTNDLMLPIHYFSFYQPYHVHNVEVYSIFDESSPFYPRILRDALHGLFPEAEGKRPVVFSSDVKESGYESIHLSVRFVPQYLKVRENFRTKRMNEIYPNVLDNASDVFDFPDSVIKEANKLTMAEWYKVLKVLDQTAMESESPAANPALPIMSRLFAQTRNSLSTSIDRFMEFPIEVQVRTTLQDTWAQVEHSIRYKPLTHQDNSSNQSSNATVNIRAASFDSQTIMISALDRMQLVTQGLHRDLDGERNLVGKGLDLAKRAIFFEEDDEKNSVLKIQNLNKQLHKAVTEGEKGYSAAAGFAAQLVLELENLETLCGVNFRSFVIEADPKIWGKRRFALLLIGFLLVSGIAELSALAIRWLRMPPEKLKHPIPNVPSLAASFIYDHIRFVDMRFRYTEQDMEHREFFSDPLVFYRNAFCAAWRGEVQRAIELLREPIDNDYFTAFWRVNENDRDPSASQENLKTLNPARFQRRIAQYLYYTAYRVDPPQKDQLFRAMNELSKLVFNSGPSEGTKWAFDEATEIRERVKAACLLVEVYFMHYVSVGGGCKNFARKVSEVRESIGADRWREIISGAVTSEDFNDTELKEFLRGSPTVFSVRALQSLIDGKYIVAKEQLNKAIDEADKKNSRTHFLHSRRKILSEIRDYIDITTSRRSGLG